MSVWVAIDYTCRYCGQQLRARPKEGARGLALNGIPYLEYRHVHGGVYCIKTYEAEPYDGWAAAKKYKEVKDAHNPA